MRSPASIPSRRGPPGAAWRNGPRPSMPSPPSQGIEVRTPVSLKSPEEQARFAALEADAAVVVAYGLLLPKPILDAPRLGCFNVHASLLPRWRGAAPIQRAIMAGDAETGVTIMRMEEGLDTGPMCKVGRIAITPATTAQSLHDELAALGARLMVEVLAQDADRLRAAARGGRHLCEEDRQGRGAHRLHAAAPRRCATTSTASRPFPARGSR